MASGQVVMLPEKNPEHAIQKIIILDEAEQILSRNISVFDLRLPSRITVKFHQINMVK